MGLRTTKLSITTKKLLAHNGPIATAPGLTGITNNEISACGSPRCPLLSSQFVLSSREFALASHACTAGWSLGMEAGAKLPISFELKWNVFNKDPFLERIN
jgi:hypothetical protein